MHAATDFLLPVTFRYTNDAPRHSPGGLRSCEGRNQFLRRHSCLNPVQWRDEQLSITGSTHRWSNDRCLHLTTYANDYVLAHHTSHNIAPTNKASLHRVLRRERKKKGTCGWSLVTDMRHYVTVYGAGIWLHTILWEKIKWDGKHLWKVRNIWKKLVAHKF